MDFVQQAALAGSLAWASGFRLYAVVFAAGLLSRLGYLHLPDSLQVLQGMPVIAVAGILCTAEFLADKVPWVDSLWDAVHTFIRIPAGAVLAALALGGHDPTLTAVAGLLGGTLAAGTHAAKAGARALLNASPEPVTNLAASFSEDAALAGGLYAAFVHPLLFLALLAVFVLLLGLTLPLLWGGVRMVWERLARRAPAGPRNGPDISQSDS